MNKKQTEVCQGCDSSVSGCMFEQFMCLSALGPYGFYFGASSFFDSVVSAGASCSASSFLGSSAFTVSLHR